MGGECVGVDRSCGIIDWNVLLWCILILNNPRIRLQGHVITAVQQGWREKVVAMVAFRASTVRQLRDDRLDWSVEFLAWREIVFSWFRMSSGRRMQYSWRALANIHNRCGVRSGSSSNLPFLIDATSCGYFSIGGI